MVFLVGTKPHDPLHASTVEQHYLVICRKMRHITLKIPAFIVPVRRLTEHNNTGFAWTKLLSDALNSTVLAACITAFKNDQNPIILLNDVFLQFDQFDL